MNEHVRRRLERHFAASAERDFIFAYLFGAHAAGRAHRESDVDVGVLLDRSLSAQARFQARVRLTSELMHALHRNEVDVVVLNDAPPELGRTVVTRGVLVYSADAEAEHAYRRDIQLRAADLDPFLRRMRRIKLEALRR